MFYNFSCYNYDKVMSLDYWFLYLIILFLIYKVRYFLITEITPYNNSIVIYSNFYLQRNLRILLL